MGVSLNPLAKLVSAEDSQWSASSAETLAVTAGDSTQSSSLETTAEETADMASAPPEIATRRSIQTQYVPALRTPRESIGKSA